MWAIKNINCTSWAGMQLYQNNAAFVLCAVGIKWDTDIVGVTGAGWSWVLSHVLWSCFSTLLGLFLQIQLSWRFSGHLSEQIMCDFSEYCCYHKIYLFILQLIDMSLEASGWSTCPLVPYGYVIDVFVFPSVKWEMSLIIKFLSALVQGLAEPK